MTLLITVKDLETGHEDSMEIPEGDYGLICHDPCYLYYVEKPTKGTVVLTIRGRTEERDST